MKKGFVFLDEIVRGIRWDAKYATWDNFTGKPVDGYEANRIVGSCELAAALLEAKELAAAAGYGLLLWDAYRPQRAVNCFLQWAQQPENGLTKNRYYPHLERAEMIARGYVMPRSGHSRGGAVDLTLYCLETGALLPMGSDFDLMDRRSYYLAEEIPEEAKQNRLRLRALMEGSGFKPYDLEWWHFVLENEPYPDQYFDFVAV